MNKKRRLIGISIVVTVAEAVTLSCLALPCLVLPYIHRSFGWRFIFWMLSILDVPLISLDRVILRTKLISSYHQHTMLSRQFECNTTLYHGICCSTMRQSVLHSNQYAFLSSIADRHLKLKQYRDNKIIIIISLRANLRARHNYKLIRLQFQFKNQLTKTDKHQHTENVY